jgi:hypothetical protein
MVFPPSVNDVDRSVHVVGFGGVTVALLNRHSVVDPPCDAGSNNSNAATTPLLALAAAWLTVTCWPAIDTVPVRAAPVFAATEKVSAPLPEPLERLVSTINPSLLTADQLHPLEVEMLIVELPPAAATVTLFVDRTIAHNPPPALNDSTAENAVVNVPLVARARQK